MTHPFSKKSDSDPKTVKKYLTESLIGPSHLHPDLFNHEQSELLNYSAISLQSRPEDLQRTHSLSDVFENSFSSPIAYEHLIHSNSSKSFLESGNRQIIEDQIASQHSLASYLKKEYFSGGKHKKDLKDITPGMQHVKSSEKEEFIPRSQSMFVNSSSFPKSGYYQKEEDIQIEIKEVDQENDSGNIYDYVIKISALGSNNRSYTSRKIFIEDYLDMENLRSDDIGQYCKGVAKNVRGVLHKSVALPPKEVDGMQRVSENSKNVDQENHRKNASVLFPNPSSISKKDPNHEMLENYDLTIEEVHHKVHKDTYEESKEYENNIEASLLEHADLLASEDINLLVFTESDTNSNPQEKIHHLLPVPKISRTLFKDIVEEFNKTTQSTQKKKGLDQIQKLDKQSISDENSANDFKNSEMGLELEKNVSISDKNIMSHSQERLILSPKQNRKSRNLSIGEVKSPIVDNKEINYSDQNKQAVILEEVSMNKYLTKTGDIEAISHENSEMTSPSKIKESNSNLSLSSHSLTLNQQIENISDKISLKNNLKRSHVPDNKDHEKKLKKRFGKNVEYKSLLEWKSQNTDVGDEYNQAEFLLNLRPKENNKVGNPTEVEAKPEGRELDLELDEKDPESDSISIKSISDTCILEEYEKNIVSKKDLNNVENEEKSSWDIQLKKISCFTNEETIDAVNQDPNHSIKDREKVNDSEQPFSFVKAEMINSKSESQVEEAKTFSNFNILKYENSSSSLKGENTKNQSQEKTHKLSLCSSGVNLESSEDIKAQKPETEPQRVDKINFPPDPLDLFDNDVNDIEVNIQSPEGFCMVSNSRLLQPDEIEIANKVQCKKMTECLDTLVAKNSFGDQEVTLIKLAPPGFIFIGTKSSTVLVFDSKQNFKKQLLFSGTLPGAVTAMDYRTQETICPTLLVGFSTGQIAICDLKTLNIVKTIKNISTKQVTSIKVIKTEPIEFVASDEAGQLFRYKIKKNMWLQQIGELHLLMKTDQPILDVQMMAKDIRAKTGISLVEEEQLRYIFALSKIDEIVLVDARDITLTEPAKSIYIFKRPKYVKDFIVPTISWGVSAFVKFVQTTFLAIGWGSVVHLIKFSYEESQPAFKYIGHFVLSWALIKHCGWINENIIQLIDDKNIIHFIHFDRFKEGEFDDQSQGFSAVIDEKAKGKMYSLPLEDNLRPTLTYIEKEQDIQPFYKGSVSISWSTHESLILGEKALYKIKILSAFEYLNTLYQNHTWLDFLAAGLQIFNYNIKEFWVPYDVISRKEYLHPFFRDKIGNYLDQQLCKKENNEHNYQQIMYSLFDFLSGVQDYEYLFTTCQERITQVGLRSLYLEFLEPFLTSGKIKYVPDNCLKSLIVYYCQQNKRGLIQKLLQGLDLAKQDSSLLLHLCLEHSLYQALIEICTKIDDNYITPFVKLINDYQTAKADNSKEAQNYGYRCLWYLKLILNNRFTMKLKSKESVRERWKTQVFQMMMMIFEPKYLKVFFEIDGELIMCFMLLFFVGDLAQMIEERYGDFSIGHSVFSQFNTDDIHFQIYEALKYGLTLWSTEEQMSSCMQYFGFFLGKVAQLMRYSFLDRNLCVHFVKLFIPDPSLISDRVILLWEKTRLEHEGQSREQIEDYFKEKVTKEFIISQRISILRDLLRYCQFTITIKDASDLILKAKEADLIEIECMLLTIKDDYKRCLEIYLSSRAPSELRDKVFGWITRTIRTHYEKTKTTENETKEIEQLKMSIIERLPILVKLNKERTKMIIEEFLKDRMGLVMRKLRLDPSYQLEVLEKFMKKKETKTLDPELLVLHIYLLARSNEENKNRIIQVLQSSSDYPIDACLEICEIYEIKDAWAYLEFKLGNILRAVELTSEALSKEINNCLKKPDFKYNSEKEKILSIINAYFEYLQHHDRNTEPELWFDALLKTYILIDDTISKFKKIDDPEKMKEINMLKQETVDHMLDYILGSLQSLDVLRILSSKEKSMPEKLRLLILEKIVLNNAHEKFVIDQWGPSVRKNLYTLQNLKLYPEMIRGTHHSPSCQSCYQSFLDHENLLWFGCGHLYHASETCCSKGICQLCKYSSSSFMSKLSIMKMGNNMSSVKAQAAMPTTSQKVKAENIKKSEQMLRTNEETKEDLHKNKLAKFHQFAKQKTKKQKELQVVFEKYL